MSAPTFVMPNDLSDLCRVCLQLPEESQYLDLTTIYDEEDNLTYGECFTVCTHIDLSAGEGVPHHLCKSCGLELQMTYDFYKKIEESKKVIEQCRRQIEEQQKENTQHLLAGQPNNPDTHIIDGSRGMEQLINAKYELSDDDVLPGTSQDMEHNVRVMDQENEENFAVLPNENAEEVSAELDIISKICEEHGVAPDKDDNRTIKEVGENYAATEHVEDNLEIEDYQNLEALDEEEKRRRLATNIQTVFSNDDHRIRVRDEFRVNLNNETALTYNMETSEENASDHYDNNLDPTLFLEANQFLPEIKHENESADEYIVPSTTDPNFSNVNINEPFEQKPNIGFGFKCELCGHSMPTKNALYKHRFRKHNLKGFTQSSMPESCHLCLKVLSSRDSLKQHMEAKHTNNTYVCDHCGHSLPTKNALSQHRIRKHRDIEKEQKKPKFKCTTCSQNFDTPENLNSHKATEHAKRVFVTPDSEVYFECEECGHKLPTRNSLSQHRLRKHRPKKEGKHTFTCVYCDMVLPSVQRLQKHLLDSHDAIPGLKQMVDNM